MQGGKPGIILDHSINGFLFRLCENFGPDGYLSSRGSYYQAVLPFIFNDPLESVPIIERLETSEGPSVMALNDTVSIALAVGTLGVLAFIFGVVAENKKPDGGTPILAQGIVICSYPHDPTIGLGALSVICLFLSCICGLLSVFYPYKGRAVPVHALSRSTALVTFLVIAMALTFLAEGLMIWATVTESLHRKRNVHHDLTTDCPTAKTGLFGGAAFLALDASLFWLICQMLTTDARADYEDGEEMRGKYGQIPTRDYTAAASHVHARA